MKTRNLLLLTLCFSLVLTACSRRLRDQNTQPAAPTQAQNIIATNPPPQPTAAPPTVAPTEVQAATEAPTSIPPTATLLPADTATPESDASGDALETLLQQLDDANTAADPDIQNLPNP